MKGASLLALGIGLGAGLGAAFQNVAPGTDTGVATVAKSLGKTD